MVKVKLTGFIEIPEHERRSVTEALVTHIELTRSEKGCLHFDVKPDPNNPLIYMVDELFESRQAFEFHQQRVANSRWGEISKNVLRHYQISEI